MAHILAVDDDPSALFLFREALQAPGRPVETAPDAATGLEKIRKNTPSVILLDLVLPDGSGLELLQKIRDVSRRVPIIVITGEADAETAIEAMRLGAYDYVAKPVDIPILRELVAKALRLHAMSNTPVALAAGGELEAASAGPAGKGDAFVGTSPEMLEVFKTIGRCAAQRVPVLIRGESGTGKELVARAIYQHSDRASEQYMAINCAALPDTLLESELFGHEKGAFTSADRRRIGKFEQCSGGTIFLDEIGDMAPLIQAKILRLLQDQKFERVGGNDTIKTDVRIIAATNRPLEEMVETGKFRADLLYRLNGVTIELPPLRNRKSDLKVLTRYFLSQATREMSRHDLEGMAPDTVNLLQEYSWPGNVRELQSVVRQSIINCNSSVIAPEHLPDELSMPAIRVPVDVAAPATILTPGMPSSEDALATPPLPDAAGEHELPGTVVPAGGMTDETEIIPANPEDGLEIASFVRGRLDDGSTDLYAEAVEAVERALFSIVLRHTGGNQSRASEILGITRGKVRDRIAAFDIQIERTVTLD